MVAAELASPIAPPSVQTPGNAAKLKPAMAVVKLEHVSERLPMSMPESSPSEAKVVLVRTKAGAGEVRRPPPALRKLTS
jgi:hypothetical protein